MTKFTEGPWKHEAGFPTSIWAKGDIWVASANCETVPFEQRIANARLISLAPEMYEALKNAREMLADSHTESDPKNLPDRSWAAYRGAYDALTGIDAILSRVEGSRDE